MRTQIRQIQTSITELKIGDIGHHLTIAFETPQKQLHIRKEQTLAVAVPSIEEKGADSKEFENYKERYYCSDGGRGGEEGSTSVVKREYGIQYYGKVWRMYGIGEGRSLVCVRGSEAVEFRYRSQGGK